MGMASMLSVSEAAKMEELKKELQAVLKRHGVLLYGRIHQIETGVETCHVCVRVDGVEHDLLELLRNE